MLLLFKAFLQHFKLVNLCFRCHEQVTLPNSLSNLGSTFPHICIKIFLVKIKIFSKNEPEVGFKLQLILDWPSIFCQGVKGFKNKNSMLQINLNEINTFHQISQNMMADCLSNCPPFCTILHWIVLPVHKLNNLRKFR